MKKKRSKPPANATAWCALHERLMNDVYIRRRGCVMRRCKHLHWLNRIARKYGVDYAIKRDRSSNPPKFLIFFKSRDADALTSAFNEYVGKKVKKASRPSVLQRLAHFKELVKNTVVNREKRRELER